MLTFAIAWLFYKSKVDNGWFLIFAMIADVEIVREVAMSFHG